MKFDDQEQINKYLCSLISKEDIVELVDESTELRSSHLNIKVLGNSIIERYGYVTDYCYVYHPHMKKMLIVKLNLRKRSFGFMIDNFTKDCDTLICINTCEKDADELEYLKKSDFYKN